MFALTSCKKETINPEGSDLACYACETSFQYQNDKNEFVAIGDTIRTDYCDVSSLKIARLQVENSRWTWYQGKRTKQIFTCVKKIKWKEQKKES